jgi:hypothetical protein
MKRLIAASAAVVFVVGMLATSSVRLSAAGKTVMGTVAALSTDSITIKTKDTETKLAVDSKTKVIGTGMGTKSAKMKDEKKPTQITDMLKVGDEVSATYDEGTKHATEVRLKAAAAK